MTEADQERPEGAHAVGAPRGRGIAVLVGVGIGVASAALLTLALLWSTGPLRPALAGIYSGLAIGGILLAVLGWFFLQD